MKHAYNRFSILLLIAFFGITFLSAQTTIAAWNFESFTRLPYVGSGSLTLIGGVLEDWSKTGTQPGVAIPAGLKEKDEHKSGIGLQTLNYPAQGTNAKTAGIQISVSTVGYKNVMISADVRQGGTSANKLQLQYTTDGVEWKRAVTYTTDNNDAWFLRNYNFSNIEDVNNNSKFAVRFVTNFDDDVVGMNVYVPVNSSNVYSPSGSIRYDNILFRADPLNSPEDTRTALVVWDFENYNRVPSVGVGTMTLQGGIFEDWTRSGIIPGQTIHDQGVYDYSALRDGVGMQTVNYPGLVNAPKSAGIQMNISTLGYKDIEFIADVRHGNTSANNMYLQYSVDGTNWIDATNYIVNSGDTWYRKGFDFSTITEVNNQSNLRLRLVTAFDGLSYMATGIGKDYLSTGPIRFDNIVVRGKLLTSASSIDDLSNLEWKILADQIIFNQLPTSNIQIYNLAGVLLMQSEPAESISISELNYGVYILKTSGKAGKFIKN